LLSSAKRPGSGSAWDRSRAAPRGGGPTVSSVLQISLIMGFEISLIGTPA
jgi:hypothetical protein